MTLPSVQWKLDNQEEIEHLLRNHHFRCKPDGDNLLIQGAHTDLDTHLAPGDSIILDGDRLGILRVDVTKSH